MMSTSVKPRGITDLILNKTHIELNVINNKQNLHVNNDWPLEEFCYDIVITVM